MRIRSNTFFVPHKVKVEDLKSNGSLLEDNEAALVSKKLIDQQEGRCSKESVGMRYGVHKGKNRYYTVYNYSKEEQCELSDGGFGRIKIAESSDSGQWVVIKTQVIDNKKERGIFENECKILQTLNKLVENPTLRKTRKIPQKLKGDIVMPLIRGLEVTDLLRLSNEEKSVYYNPPALFWMDVIISIIQKLQLIHQANILHRDIKHENIIFDPLTGNAEFVDFGFAVQLNNQVKYYRDKYILGTEASIAPELRDNIIYNESTEIYALGVAMREILYNCQGAINKKNHKLYFKRVGDSVFKDNIELLRFINEKMLNQNFYKRPNLQEVLDFFGKARHAYSDQLELKNEFIQRLQKIESDRLNAIKQTLLNKDKAAARGGISRSIANTFSSLFQSAKAFAVDGSPKKDDSISMKL